MQTWIGAGLPIASLSLLTPDAVDGTVVDVRQANEFAAGHVPGAINIELGTIATAPSPGGPLTLMCAHGERAMSAASILEADIADDLRIVLGGPEDWSKYRSQPLEVE